MGEMVAIMGDHNMEATEAGEDTMVEVVEEAIMTEIGEALIEEEVLIEGEARSEEEIAQIDDPVLTETKVLMQEKDIEVLIGEEVVQADVEALTEGVWNRAEAPEEAQTEDPQIDAEALTIKEMKAQQKTNAVAHTEEHPKGQSTKKHQARALSARKQNQLQHVIHQVQKNLSDHQATPSSQLLLRTKIHRYSKLGTEMLSLKKTQTPNKPQ